MKAEHFKSCCSGCDRGDPCPQMPVIVHLHHVVQPRRNMQFTLKMFCLFWSYVFSIRSSFVIISNWILRSNVYCRVAEEHALGVRTLGPSFCASCWLWDQDHCTQNGVGPDSLSGPYQRLKILFRCYTPIQSFEVPSLLSCDLFKPP